MNQEYNNITKLSNEYTLKKDRENRNEKRKKFARRRLTIFATVAILFFAGLSSAFYKQYNQLQAGHQTKEQHQKLQEDLKTEQASLSKEVKLLQDEGYVAKLARSKYYYSLKGEKVYTVPGSQLPSDVKEDATDQVAK